MASLEPGELTKMIEGSCHCGKARWSFEGVPEGATACNCTICRRYGVLWAYDFEGEKIRLSGPTQVYVWGSRTLGFQFCPDCGCVICWRSVQPRKDGRRRVAVNLRLAEPDAVSAVPMDRFDGLESFEDLPRDGRCVADMWF